MMAPLLSSAILVALLSCAFLPRTSSIQCWGGEAFSLQQAGEQNCRSTTFGYSFSSCWEMCGGISYFQGQCGGGTVSEWLSLCKSDPIGKTLCPAMHQTTCDCTAWSGWDGLFNGEACPRCDDYSKIPPVMMSVYPDPDYSGIKLVDCPNDYDMCFASCHKIPYQGTVLKDGNNKCAFGCMKSVNKALVELMVSQSLADADYQHKQNALGAILNPSAGILVSPYSPNQYTRCDGSGSTYDCQVKFCTMDGCNALPMTFWDKHRILKGFRYPICILGGLGVLLSGVRLR